jgi:hypothetical protein
VPEVTQHHLVPKDEGGGGGPVADLCPACHRQLHALYDNRALATRLGSLEALRADPTVQRFVRWVRKQDPGRRVAVRRARGR